MNRHDQDENISPYLGRHSRRNVAVLCLENVSRIRRLAGEAVREADKAVVSPVQVHNVIGVLELCYGLISNIVIRLESTVIRRLCRKYRGQIQEQDNIE